MFAVDCSWSPQNETIILASMEINNLKIEKFTYQLMEEFRL